jgi:hypothetical protein
MRFRALASTCTIAVVAAGMLIAAASPGGAQEITAADCGTTTYRWLFWPEGHGTLKAVPHPATDVPHVDVYSGKGKKFTEAQNVAYADGNAVTTGATCTPVAPSGSGSASLRSTTQAKQLACTFTANPTFVAVPESTIDQPSLAALVDGKLLVHTQLGRTSDESSNLDYDGKVCKLTKPPK